MKNTIVNNFFKIKGSQSAIIFPNSMALLPLNLSQSQTSLLTLIAWALLPQMHAIAEGGTATTAEDGMKLTIVGKDYGLTTRKLSAMAEGTKAFGGHITMHQTKSIKRSPVYEININQRVMEKILDLHKGYFYIDPMVSMSMTNKTDVRFYWLMQLFSHKGAMTMTVPSLKNAIGAIDCYDKYFTFEQRVISHAQQTMDKLFGMGVVNVHFTFVRIYNKPRRCIVPGGTPAGGKGLPDAISFTIMSRTGKADGKTETLTADKDVMQVLCEDLHLPEKVAEAQAKRVDASRKQAFINFAITVKEVIDEKRSRGEKLRNPVAYIRTAINNFFLEREEDRHSVPSRPSRPSKPSMPSEPSRPIMPKMPTKPTAPTTPRRPFGEWKRLWEKVLAEYGGSAKEALLRATFMGEERDVFLVKFASKADKDACANDYKALNTIAKRVLGINNRFQPAVIMA